MTSATMRAACAALTVWAAACGGDESDYETQTNPQYAAQVVWQLAGIGGGVTAASPDLTSSGVLQLGNVAQLIITPVFEEQALRRPPAPAPLVGDCTCDAAGCRFDGCAADDGSWTMDGSIAVSGETYSFDLAMTQHYGSDNFTIDADLTTSGEITIGAEVIDGQVSGEMDTLQVLASEDETFEIEGWFDWSVDLAQVSLDETRCAVGGTLDASVSAEAESGGRDADYRGSGMVAFGPACGDAVVVP